MRKKIIAAATILISLVGLVQAQIKPIFQVEVTMDSVLLGNRIEVTFLLENGEGDDFQPPEFEAFDVISGPSTYSSFSSINGKVTRSTGYKYYIEPREVGSFYIEPASVNVGGKVLETMPVEIMVYPNPEGIIQQPSTENKEDLLDFWDFEQKLPSEKTLPQKRHSKRRKIYKL